MKKTDQKIKYIGIGIAASIIIFLGSGIVTAIIPNSIFIRMIPTSIFDYIFLVLTSVLAGSWISIHFYQRTSQTGYKSALGGCIGGFFAFGCPICNKLILLVLGVSGALTFFDPLRIPLGILSVGLLSYAIYLKIKSNKCKKCSYKRFI